MVKLNDTFQFYNHDQPELVYTAVLHKGHYFIIWNDVDFEHTYVVYKPKEVKWFIDEGFWVVKQKEAPAK